MAGLQRTPVFAIVFLVWVCSISLHLQLSVAMAHQTGNALNGDGMSKKFTVDMVGFNYTDRVIESFSVNGSGAGNVLLSSKNSGGGKTACCVTILIPASGTPRINVRWQVDGCTYSTRSKISGEVFENIFPYYRQVEVEVSFSKKNLPQNLEVHFYPDGTVKAQLVESLSLPRILLDGQRADKSNFPRCRDDKKPQ